MELRYDWKNFRKTFYPQKRSALSQETGVLSPVYFVVEENTIVSGFCETEDLADWKGAPCDEVDAHFQHRDIYYFDKSHLDGVSEDQLKSDHSYAQERQLIESSFPVLKNHKNIKRERNDLSEFDHFLFNAFRGWWSKLLPSSFGILIRVKKEKDVFEDFFFIMRKGKMDNYHSPDLSALKDDRELDIKEVVKYLSEKHSVKVQSLTVEKEEWLEWSHLVDPWKKVAASIRANRAQLFPFRWRLVVLMSFRAFWGL